jgi:hypothetical protein
MDSVCSIFELSLMRLPSLHRHKLVMPTEQRRCAPNHSEAWVLLRIRHALACREERGYWKIEIARKAPSQTKTAAAILYICVPSFCDETPRRGNPASWPEQGKKINSIAANIVPAVASV